MVWPFSKKKASGLPQQLVFKSGEAFLEYQCKYGHTDIRTRQGIVALVVDSAKEFGAEKAVKIEPDGTQIVALKVASEDGGFFVIARTASGRGDRLKPDDVVVWVPVMHSNEVVPKGVDERFGWAGFVVAKVKPEINTTNPNLNVTCRYD